MSIKITIEYVTKQFEKESYNLLSKEYINCREKLSYICSKGHEHSISWDDWRHGRRCPYCAGKIKKTIEFIRFEFLKEGYNLLINEYRSSFQKLSYICPNGHKHYIKWNDWQQGIRCFYCYEGNVKLTIEFINFEFEKEGYKLLTKEYNNAFSKLDYICSNNHIHSIRWNDWQQGHRCIYCGMINNSGSLHYNWKGGISCEPYCDSWADKEFKEDIKTRDNYKCQNPDCWGTSETLCIHHIDYNKKNCNPNNLITICNSCNSRANKDREWHTKWYQILMDKKCLQMGA